MCESLTELPAAPVRTTFASPATEEELAALAAELAGISC